MMWEICGKLGGYEQVRFVLITDENKGPKIYISTVSLDRPSDLYVVFDRDVSRQYTIFFSFDFCALIKLRIGTHLNQHMLRKY